MLLQGLPMSTSAVRLIWYGNEGVAQVDWMLWAGVEVGADSGIFSAPYWVSLSPTLGSCLPVLPHLPQVQSLRLSVNS